MRVGELSRRSGVSVASIKYYLREGLLAPGERTGPNQAAYGDDHLRRLRTIRALIDVGGLSVATTREVLAAADDPDLPLHEALGLASATTIAAPPSADAAEHDEARAVAERHLTELVAERGWFVSSDAPAWAAAAEVLATYVRLGDDDLAAQLGLYAQAMEGVAEQEVTTVVDRGDRTRTVEGVVVGTVLGDALLAAVRRLAQQHCSRRLLKRAEPTARG